MTAAKPIDQPTLSEAPRKRSAGSALAGLEVDLRLLGMVGAADRPLAGVQHHVGRPVPVAAQPLEPVGPVGRGRDHDAGHGADHRVAQHRPVDRVGALDAQPHPERRPKSDPPAHYLVNANSLGVRIRHGNVVFLLPGDIQREDQVRSLLPSVVPGKLRCQVLVAPGHGIHSVPEFAEATRPEVTVASAPPRYAKTSPAPKVFGTVGSRVFLTGLHGRVTVGLDGDVLQGGGGQRHAVPGEIEDGLLIGCVPQDLRQRPAGCPRGGRRGAAPRWGRRRRCRSTSSFVPARDPRPRGDEDGVHLRLGGEVAVRAGRGRRSATTNASPAVAPLNA